MAGSLRRCVSRIAAVAAVVAVCGPVPAAHATGMVVLPGYDLFRTLPGTRIGVRLPGAPDTVVRFTSEPLHTFSFGTTTVSTGGADTIVRRLDTATPDDGTTRVQLLALQMRSYQPVGYFVTLQSDRGRNPLDPPAGAPSVGLLDIAFDPDGLGGTYQSKLVVNYDVRAAAPDGPIVASGSAPIVDHDVWQHARPTEPVGGCHDEAVAIGHCIGVDTDTKQVCSSTTSAPIPALTGIDTDLDGASQDGDFHPFTTPGTANDTTICVGATTPIGPKCRVDSATDVTREAGWQTGDIAAGPLVVGEAGTLKCSIHVNNHQHSGSAAVVVSVNDTTGVVAVMAPQLVNFQATAADDVSLCTEWDAASGGRQYWAGSDPAVPGAGQWSTDPNASCGAALTVEPNDPECSIWLAIDERLGTNIAEIWQDCEPYSPII